MTIVADKLYRKAGRIQIEILVGQAKKFHDKREASKMEDRQDEAKAAMAGAAANNRLVTFVALGKGLTIAPIKLY